jgi:hypothetical protein
MYRYRSMTAARVLLVVALLPLLLGGPHSSSVIRVASGQGLSVSADNMGAGAEATANEFEQFESALEQATKGGTGRWAVCCTVQYSALMIPHTPHFGNI